MLVCVQFAQLLDGYPLLGAYVRGVHTVPRMSIASETVHIDGSQIRHFNLAGNSDCVRIEETQILTITVM